MNCSFCNQFSKEYNNIYDFFDFKHKHFLKYDIGIDNDIICISCCKKKVIKCKYCNYISLNLSNAINCDVCSKNNCINCLSVNYSVCCSTRFLDCKLCNISKGHLIKKYCSCKDNICIFCCQNVQYFKCDICYDDVCDKCEFINTCRYCTKVLCNSCSKKHYEKNQDDICISCNVKFHHCYYSNNKCFHGYSLCDNCMYEKTKCYFCNNKCTCCSTTSFECSDDKCSVIHSKLMCVECYQKTYIKYPDFIGFNRQKRLLNVKKCKNFNKLFCYDHLFKCKLCNDIFHTNFKKNNLNTCNLCFNKLYPFINHWKEYMYRPNSKYVTEKLTNRFNDNLDTF